MAKVVVDDESGCWLWVASFNSCGYAIFWFEGSYRLGHRWAYEHWVGDLPPGTLDHFVCETRRCVNPQHVRPASQRENILRGSGPSAANAAKTHCVAGHLLEGDNLWPTSDGHRRCALCGRRRARDYQRRRRAVV